MTGIALPLGLARPRSALPGFPVTMGITMLWLGIVVLIPLTALVLRPWELGIGGVWAAVSSDRAVAALRTSFGTALLAAVIDIPLGLLVTWVLVRYRFPGRGIADAMIDLPFALPTAVAGISLTALYAENGWVGALLKPLGISLAYNPGGIVVALAFVGLPFIVRTLEPVLRDLPRDTEEAAAMLGAGRWATFRRVLLPTLAPALIAGFGLAFARAVGEYGSVIFIAGNMPMFSEIAPLLIVVRLEEFDYAGAAAIGLAMLLLSFVVLLALGLLSRSLCRSEA